MTAEAVGFFTHGMRAIRTAVLPGALLAVYVVLALSSVATKSPTYDEPLHLTGGYSALAFNDYRLNPENGSLPQRWAALPLLWMKPHFPSHDEDLWRQSELTPISYAFFYKSGNDPERMLFAGRVMMSLLAAGLGVLIYAWSRRLHGPAGGLLSLSLFTFCPTMLAHGPLVTSDVAAAAFFVASLWSFWAMLHRVSWRTVLVAALALAGVCLSKFSAVLMFPMGGLLLIVRLAGRRPLVVNLQTAKVVTPPGQQATWIGGAILVQLLLVWMLIWGWFGWRYSMFAEVSPGTAAMLPWETLLPKAGMTREIIEFAREVKLLPEAFLYGFSFVLAFSKSRPAFLNGEFGIDGWTSFFPYCWLVKTPLPVMAVVVFAAAAGWRAALKKAYVMPGPQEAKARSERRSASPTNPREGSALSQLAPGLYDRAPLIVLLVVYWAFALNSHLNIGQRHILPTYPPLYILAGSAASWLVGFNRQTSQRFPDEAPLARWGMPLALMASLLLFVSETCLTWPNYLSYFNSLAGGSRQGYRHLVDSSLDWGQDLPALRQWLDQNGDLKSTQPVYLAYMGTASPEWYGIQATLLPCHFERWTPAIPHALQPGIYCISATMLQGVYLNYPGPWTRIHEQAYQEVTAQIQTFRDAANDQVQLDRLMEQTGKAFWGETFQLYEQLRFSRLCSLLRKREPLAEAGYSILIYQVTASDLAAAFAERPPELVTPSGAFAN